jgi:hypothetical protein
MKPRRRDVTRFGVGVAEDSNTALEPVASGLPRQDSGD